MWTPENTQRLKLAVLCIGLSACAKHTNEEPQAGPSDPSGCHEVMVSYYADEFSGRRTANGETYRPEHMTAAHRTLPFGTVVHLEYHGKSVTVRVNDRGPYVRSMTFDLSRAAATELDIIRAGHARVRMCPVAGAR